LQGKWSSSNRLRKEHAMTDRRLETMAVFDDDTYEEATILFDEVVDKVKEPFVREVLVKAAKAAAVLTVVAFGKYAYKYYKDGGKEDIEKLFKVILKGKILGTS
jgi:hypothetical protein